MGELLKVRQIAEKPQLHPATVYGLIRSGSVEAIRLPGGSLRIEAKELEKLLGQSIRRSGANRRKTTSAKTRK